MTHILLILSIIIQIVVVLITAAAMRFTTNRLAWATICVAFCLMAYRRIQTLAAIFMQEHEPLWQAEVTALIISSLLMIGIACMYLQQIKTAKAVQAASRITMDAMDEIDELLDFEFRNNTENEN